MSFPHDSSSSFYFTLPYVPSASAEKRQTAGDSAEIAVNGIDAMAKIRQGTFYDLILMDIRQITKKYIKTGRG